MKKKALKGVLLTTSILFLSASPFATNAFASDTVQSQVYGNDSLIQSNINSKSSQLIQPNAVFNIWSIESKTLNGTTYGAWRGGASTQKSNTAGSLMCSAAISEGNSYTAGLKVTKGALDATMQFNTTDSFTLTASRTVTVEPNTFYKIEYRPTFKMYIVKQKQTQYDNAGGERIVGYESFKVYQFDGIDFRVIKS